MKKNFLFRFFDYLGNKISFGFAATFFISPCAIITTFYSYYFVIGSVKINNDQFSVTIITLSITLAILTIFHVLYVGSFGKFGLLGFSDTTKLINKHLDDNFIRNLKSISNSELNKLYNALIFFPMESFIISFSVAFALIFISTASYFVFEINYDVLVYIFIGGLFGAFYYGYFTFLIIEYFIGPTKSRLERILTDRNEEFEVKYLMSYRKKSILTEILIIFNIVLLIIILNHNKPIFETIIFIFVSICSIGFLILLLNNSVSISLQRICIATSDLIEGRKGYYFPTFLDYELVMFSKNYNKAAYEVNQLRQDLEKSVDKSTSELTDAYDQLSSLYQHILTDLNISRKIQGKILPRNFKKIDGLSIYVHYDPMIKIGGDLYDIFELKPGYVRFLLADAMGNGVQAALVSMIVKTEYEKIKHIENPAVLIEKINKSFLETFGLLNVFFSCIVIDIDINKNSIYSSSAGHPDQIFIHDNEAKLIRHTGKLAGLLNESQYELEAFDCVSNDKILLFTDGLFEQYNKNNKNFGKDNIRDLVEKVKEKNVEDIVKSIVKELHEFLENENRISIYDDITIIGIEIN